jgi:hypothetical protein
MEPLFQPSIPVIYKSPPAYEVTAPLLRFPVDDPPPAAPPPEEQEPFHGEKGAVFTSSFLLPESVHFHPSFWLQGYTPFQVLNIPS